MTNFEQNKNDLAEVCREFVELYQDFEFNLINDSTYIEKSADEMEASQFIKVIKEKYGHYLEETFFAQTHIYNSLKLSLPFNIP